jgi:hypothetical protein
MRIPRKHKTVRYSRPVTAQRMRPIRGWKQRLDRCPDGIDHLEVQRAHDVGDLHQVVGEWAALGIKPGHPDDRWIVVVSAYPRES